ncbi:hypothetical protein GOP47_0030569 [Adiantum capillus-veneris]|nr:hypothetical protein GOP47_0030569 [Adiantum capillus-veneris]
MPRREGPRGPRKRLKEGGNGQTGAAEGAMRGVADHARSGRGDNHGSREERLPEVEEDAIQRCGVAGGVVLHRETPRESL